MCLKVVKNLRESLLGRKDRFRTNKEGDYIAYKVISRHRNRSPFDIAKGYTWKIGQNWANGNTEQDIQKGIHLFGLKKDAKGLQSSLEGSRNYWSLFSTTKSYKTIKVLVEPKHVLSTGVFFVAGGRKLNMVVKCCSASSLKAI